ncbi:MAG: FecR domain-containing protein [Eubacterium sp.]|nr:FecR domain-containing protein [Eubacterium sp.]
MTGKRYEHGQKRTARILTSVVVACVLVIMTVIPSSAATARATTMKLEKTEGTATLKTQNGTARKISNGMHLYSGNTLATAASSYAYVSLDGTKAVKLDEKTTTTLRQSGKQLELLVKSGKLFFNVSSPLTEKESMNVRTSSMVAGIRGTCGVVEYVNPNKSKLYLLEGKVTLGYGENATTIYGGQTATVILREKEEAGESGGSDGSATPGDSGSMTEEVVQKVYVDKLTEANVPIFAITEILSDPVLQQKIEATTDLKIAKFEEVLEESQKEPGEEAETKEEKEEEKKPEETTSSGGGYVPSTPSTGDVADPVEPSITEIDLSKCEDNTAALSAIAEAWNNGASAVTVSGNVVNADGEEIPLESIEVPKEKELIVDGEVSINGVTLAAGGTLTINKDAVLSCCDTIENNGTIINNGTLQVVETGVILASGSKLENNGEISGLFTMNTGSTFTNGGSVNGDFELNTGSTLINSGTMIALNDNSWNVSSATIDNTGKIGMGEGAISVTGNLNLSSVGTITGSGIAVISVSGGALTLGTQGATSEGSISNTSTEEGHRAIAVSGGSITWNNTGVKICTSTRDIGNTIEGMSEPESTPSYLSLAEGYTLNFNNGELSLTKETSP